MKYEVNWVTLVGNVSEQPSVSDQEEEDLVQIKLIYPLRSIMDFPYVPFAVKW